ncbi:hypothetical protein ZYGR_0AS03590 [Zygosaccharomyces rouxii]|uniref:GID complex catalytic subunit 2 n=1 Tax=Zygosaccharomyces rouxii TaxID=4956 RepID=A0A1Q3AH08_ZYGRO|nr:hypothetical protein ZYGR_0AS03590 [Zygosaccharomyces rouxii]
MSVILPSLSQEIEKLYDEENGQPLVSKCVEETHEFKTQLKKLKAHLNKHIQEVEKGGDEKKGHRRKELVVEKLNKAHKQWDHSIKKNYKHTSQQHAKISKFLQNKLHEFDLDEVYVNKLHSESKINIDKAISFHISRYNVGSLPVNGRQEIIDYLGQVYGVSQVISERFVQLGQIVQDLKNGETRSCVEWCHDDSLLQFELYTLNAMQLFRSGDVLETYKYLTENIPTSAFKYRQHQVITQVSPLLTQLLLGQKVKDFDNRVRLQQEKCISLFTKDYCAQNNLPYDSALFLIILSGVISFQFFTKYKSIRASAHVDWTTEDELPFDVKLPEFLTHFHPIFICPVLKEETTSENPPYSLPCHHILSKKSLDRLSKNGTSTFKCPYCPVNASKAKTKKVNFVML